MKPIVSIVIPLYNKAGYIAETVRSVIGQSERGWELLVVDNGSTDNGPEIVRRLGDPRVRLLECPERGASAARNFGFGQAVGEWLVFLDADDLLDVDYLRAQLAHSSNADLILCPYVEFADGQPAERGIIKRLWQGEPSRQSIIDSAIVYAPGPTHSFMIRHAFLRPATLWPEHLDRLLGEDATFWFRLINEARLGYNEQPVAHYRFWTPQSRFTTLSSPADLFNGLHAAVAENLRYLEGRGQSVTAGQSESLVRFYGSVFAQARQQGNSDLMARALHETRRWQDGYFQLCERPSLPMLVRRWLGIPLFVRLTGHA